MKKEPFDYSAFRQQAIACPTGGDKEQGVLAPLLKDLLDAVLSGELQAHQSPQRQQAQAREADI